MEKTFTLKEIEEIAAELQQGLSLDEPLGSYGEAYNDGLHTMADFLVERCKTRKHIAELRAATNAYLLTLNA